MELYDFVGRDLYRLDGKTPVEDATSTTPSSVSPTSSSSSSSSTSTTPVESFTSGEIQGNLSILDGFLESKGFIVGVKGWRLNADGTIQAVGLESTYLNIPDTTTANSFHVDTLGNTWWGATTIGSAVAKVLNTGAATFTSGSIGGFTITATSLYGGIIKTAATVGAGTTGVIMDTAGLRGYDSVLGNTFNLPTNGDAPTFSSGIINSTIFEINTNAVMRTSATVGDGSASSAGILINNTGFYACQASQLLAAANIRILIDGTGYFSGAITSTSGAIGGFDIGADYIRDSGNTMGIASTNTAGDDIRFWSGSTFANRATAPFRVAQSGATTVSSLVANNIVFGGTGSWLYPVADNTYDIGGPSNQIKDLYVGGTIYGGVPPVVNVQIFTANGNWTKPAGAIAVEVICVGSGGGGGSGRKGAAGTGRGGGAGGGGGAVSRILLIAADLGATENVTVGVGGTGGATVTTDNTNGNAGGSGSSSFFGTNPWITAGGGGGGDGGGTGSAYGGAGGGGLTSGVGSGTPGVPSAAVNVKGICNQGVWRNNTSDGVCAEFGGASGAVNTDEDVSLTGGSSIYGGAGGGCGGSISSANTTFNGGAGGLVGAYTAGGGAAGGAKDGVNPGTAGSANTVNKTGYGGGGGGGGGASKTTSSGYGGVGGLPGGGGGGGGATLDGVGSSLYGGDGGGGLVKVITYF